MDSHFVTFILTPVSRHKKTSRTMVLKLNRHHKSHGRLVRTLGPVHHHEVLAATSLGTILRESLL